MWPSAKKVWRLLLSSKGLKYIALGYMHPARALCAAHNDFWEFFKKFKVI